MVNRKNEFDRFTQRLSDFINQEIHQFGQQAHVARGYLADKSRYWYPST